MNTYLGIDPGLGGALAIYRPELPPGDYQLSMVDMPTHTITINGKLRRVIDLAALARFFDEQIAKITRAVIEDPHAMPGQGVTSAFSFGFVCGVVQSMTAAHHIPMVLYRPAIWKKQMGLTDDKDACRRIASRLFPDQSNLFARKSDDGRAEAALLAYLGSKT